MKQVANKMYELKKISSVLLMTVFLMAAACSEKKEAQVETAPHTGHDSIENEIAPVADQINMKTNLGTTAYIYSERVRARTSPEVKDDNLAGVLDLNDQVSILDSKAIGKDAFIKVEVKVSRGIKAGQIVYVAQRFLSTQKRALKTDEKQYLKYYMVQNIATETVRVYERCLDAADKKCTSKMVFQSDMVAGEDDDGTRTNIGVYKIESWMKFYEDGAKNYPAWYRPDYPAVPEPKASRAKWFDKDVMPNGKGSARGAFGWYTAFVGPNASGQWTHGTMGWGADHDDFITFKDGFFGKVVNLFAAIRSHGCSRIDNEAAAYLRHLLPIGTTVVKVYAEEASRYEAIVGYSKNKPKWDYILTKTGYGKAGGQTADAATVLASQTPQSEWIEQGQYFVDQYPEVREGNVYGIKNREFNGLFLVDQGTFYGYEHPKSIERGGFKDQSLPNYMVLDF